MWRVRIRLLLAELLSHVYLCYTKSGIEFLLRCGFSSGRVFATGNTIDQLPIKNAIAKWSDSRLSEFKKQNDLEGKFVMLVCSVLRPKVRLDQLMTAMCSNGLREKDLVLVVIGDGSERERWQQLSCELGVADKIKWLGATRDQDIMAPWFLSATVFVYPGSIGLSILHSMSYGLPVITHGNKETQMPEFEVMEDGVTGLLFKENSVQDLAGKIAWAVNHPDQIARMRNASKKKAWEDYTMEQMINNYSNAIEACHDLVLGNV